MFSLADNVTSKHYVTVVRKSAENLMQEVASSDVFLIHLLNVVQGRFFSVQFVIVLEDAFCQAAHIMSSASLTFSIKNPKTSFCKCKRAFLLSCAGNYIWPVLLYLDQEIVK